MTAIIIGIVLGVMLWQYLCYVVASNIAEDRHRSGAWSLLGLIFGLIGVALVYMLPGRPAGR